MEIDWITWLALICVFYFWNKNNNEQWEALSKLEKRINELDYWKDSFAHSKLRELTDEQITLSSSVRKLQRKIDSEVDSISQNANCIDNDIYECRQNLEQVIKRLNELENIVETRVEP